MARSMSALGIGAAVAQPTTSVNRSAARMPRIRRPLLWRLVFMVGCCPFFQVRGCWLTAVATTCDVFPLPRRPPASARRRATKSAWALAARNTRRAGCVRAGVLVVRPGLVHDRCGKGSARPGGRDVGSLPGPHPPSSLVEQSLVVAFRHPLSDLRFRRGPERLVDFIDLHLRVDAVGATTSEPNRNRSGYRFIMPAVAWMVSGVDTTYLATSSQEMSN